MSYKTFLLISMISLSCGLTQAAVTRIVSDDALSPQAIRLRIGPFGGELVLDGTDPSRVFEKWGVTFSTGHQSRILIETPFSNHNPPPFMLFNQRARVRPRDLGSGADDPLSVNFLQPMRGVLFQFPDGATGEATAFDPSGERLGAIVFDPQDGPRIGLVTGDPNGIGRVVLDFEIHGSDEEVEGLIFDPLEPRPFFRVIPQVGVGNGGGLGLETTLSLINLSNSTATGSVLFRGGDGGPLFDSPLVGNRLDFEIAPFGSREIKLDEAFTGQTDLAAGYATVESTQPIDATAVFRTTEAGSSETLRAGIEATSPGLVHLVPVRRAGEEDTGFAIANPGSEGAYLDIRIYEEGDFALNASAYLEAGAHRAFFLDDIAPQLDNDENLDATVLIRCESPVAVTSLLTRRGQAEASVPVSRLP